MIQGMEPARGAGRAYLAFLSYSTRDGRAARRLHRDLEHYRVPKRLVQDLGTRERLRPVFLDRDELPAGSDLPARIRAALDSAEWLIVLCSPAAAASDWVNREIAAFKAMGKGHRIIPVIAPHVPAGAYETALPLPPRKTNWPSSRLSSTRPSPSRRATPGSSRNRAASRSLFPATTGRSARRPRRHSRPPAPAPSMPNWSAAACPMPSGSRVLP
ncbi:MAG: toll/interleukin-1 receptor domain-containing protein [Alphaproteobacteria bacterium]